MTNPYADFDAFDDPWADDDFADERAYDRKRQDFERMAEREMRDTGTPMVWGQTDTEEDDEMTDTVQMAAPSAILGSLRAAVVALTVKRGLSAALAADLKSRRAEFEASIAELTTRAKSAAADVAAAESEVKILAEALYSINGAKKPTAGVEVKTFRSVQLTDAGAALEWARRTELCLVPQSLDVSALTALVMAGQTLPFAALIETPRATIASDLVKALGPDFTLSSFDAIVDGMAA